jgi:hypothetical protein
MESLRETVKDPTTRWGGMDGRSKGSGDSDGERKSWGNKSQPREAKVTRGRCDHHLQDRSLTANSFPPHQYLGFFVTAQIAL